MDFGDADLLAANRKDGCYPTHAMLESDVARWNEIKTFVAEKSDWFRAVTAVRIGTSEFTLYSLMNRRQSAIRTVIRSTGTE